MACARADQARPPTRGCPTCGLRVRIQDRVVWVAWRPARVARPAGRSGHPFLAARHAEHRQPAGWGGRTGRRRRLHSGRDAGARRGRPCYVFYAASALLGALGLTLVGHGRILAVVLVTSAALASTVAADLLQKTGWRVRVPYLHALLR